MELRIDYYSDQELAIQMNLVGHPPFKVNEINELFLFSYYTLAILQKLMIDAGVLAVLLASFDKDTIIKLGNDNYELPESLEFQLLETILGVSVNVNYDYWYDYLVSKAPKLVDYRGEGKKAFILSFPTDELQLKGFGLMKLWIVGYEFHSVIALFKYLAKRHIEDEIYLDQLSRVSNLMGRTYLTVKKGPKGDLVALSKESLKSVGIPL